MLFRSLAADAASRVEQAGSTDRGRVVAGGGGVAIDRPVRARVLLVEDHGDTRRAMMRLLSTIGCTVVAAASVTEALAHSSSGQKFDLLISDIGLPDGSGNEIMRELRTRMSIRGIALSGFGHEDDIRRSEEAGFQSHLVKPINFETLRRMLLDVTG